MIIEEQLSARLTQPKCGDCNHARSFHGKRRRKCQALGCLCEQWTPTYFTVAEIARRVGMTEIWVREHAAELGGEKIGSKWWFSEEDLRLPKAG